MHLAIDAVASKSGGVATELSKILAAIVDDPRINRATVFCPSADKRTYSVPLCQKINVVPRPLTTDSYFFRILWYELWLGVTCRAIGADVLLVLTNSGRGRLGIPHVTYVQQSLPFSREAVSTYDTWWHKLKIRAIRRNMMKSCNTSSRVIAPSSVMKTWLQEFFGLPGEKVETIYPSPIDFPSRADPSTNRKTIPSKSMNQSLLYVGSDYPYKKLDTLVAGLTILRKRIPGARLCLTLSKQHPYSTISGIECLGYLNISELEEAYRQSQAVVLSSLVESGALPPMEAMSLGIPVLIADRPYARDICERAAHFFDPADPEEFAEKAFQVLTNGKLRSQLIESGFDLVSRRKAAQPYKRILGICREVSESRKQKNADTTSHDPSSLPLS